MAKEKHPKGLKWLFMTEMWERFAFYIVGPSLLLFMKDKLGFESNTGVLIGLYTGAVFLIPIFGGWIADKWWGQIKTIKVGALIMMIGFLFLTFAHESFIGMLNFFLGLGLVAFGTGLLKANISVLVGNLYQTGSKLKDAGFNIFYMGINIGAASSPILIQIARVPLKEFITNHFPEMFNEYNFCYFLGAIGMILALIIFQKGKKHYTHAEKSGANSSPLSEKKTSDDMPKMSREEEWQRMLSVCVLLMVSTIFWFAFFQNYSALTDFANEATNFTQYEVKFLIDPDDPYKIVDPACPVVQGDKASEDKIHAEIDEAIAELEELKEKVAAGDERQYKLDDKYFTEKDILENEKELLIEVGPETKLLIVQVGRGEGFSVLGIFDFIFTAEIFQVFNPIYIVIFTPVIVIFWGRLRARGKEPIAPTKIMWGCFISALWPLLMALACWLGGNEGKHNMSPLWLMTAYFIVTISELLFSPMGLSYISKIAPPRIGGMAMGLWFGSVGIGGTFAGFLYDWVYAKGVVEHHTFYIIVSILLVCAGLFAIAFKKQLTKFET